jgi:cell division protein ZapA (FtsZ GTPase activity inhibitor)
MPNTEGVRVTIFNQTYSLVASEDPGRVEQLAQRVDDLMSKIAAHGANIDATRAAVLACLTLADEVDTLEQQLADLKQKVEHKAREFSLLLDEAIGPDASRSFAGRHQPPAASH